MLCDPKLFFKAAVNTGSLPFSVPHNVQYCTCVIYESLRLPSLYLYLSFHSFLNLLLCFPSQLQPERKHWRTTAFFFPVDILQHKTRPLFD